MTGSVAKVTEYWKLWPFVDWSTSSIWEYDENVGLRPEKLSFMIDREVFFPKRQGQSSSETE